MATVLHPESRQMYSWWWDSHISPKNSKWLQENLTDMDRYIKAMIKLIEEEADSFAKRAEMYYRKRPELIKLVEEFYRAYRALAERYDHATGALCQAQQTMAEAFPNQIPSIFAKEASSTSSDIDYWPSTPKMSLRIQALVDQDELHKDELGVSSQFRAVSLNGAYLEENDILCRKKGFKQLNELFPAEEGTAVSSEGKVRKVLSFLEDEGKIGERKDIKRELEEFQGEISHLSNKNATLRRQMASESERIRNLEDTLSKLKSEKESALLQYNQSMKRICCLETLISNATNEFYNIKDELVVKLNCVERQCLLLDKENQSLHMDLEAQQKELKQRVEELDKINTSIQEEHHKRMHAEVALMSMEKIHSHNQGEAEILAVEFQRVVEKLKDMEMSKAYLEKEVSELRDIITGLKEQNNSFNFKLIELQDERTLLMESKRLLENELGLHSVEKGALQEEISGLLKDKDNLQLKHHVLTEQMEVVLYKNEVLDNSLSDANIELEGLREKVKALEASCETLLGEVMIHTAEKAALVCQIRIIFQDIENLSRKCIVLEKTLSDVNAEIEDSRIKVKDFEDSWNSINHQNSSLLAEKNTLVSQVESIQETDENLEMMLMELQNKYSNLEKEKNSTLHRLVELATSIKVERQEHEAAILSSKSQLASSENKIHNLLDDSKFKEEEFKIEQEKAISTALEVFILQRCLYDLNDQNMIASKQCQKLMEASLRSEKLINQLEHKDFVQKKKMMSILEYNVKLKEGFVLLLNELNGCQVSDVADDEAIFQTILDETKNLQTSISSAQVENQRLHLEIVVLDTLLKQIGLENFHLKSELEGRNVETIAFKRKKDEVIEMNERLESEMRTLSEQFSDLHDSHQISQTENSNLLEKNWSLSKRFDNVREKNDALEKENSELLAQVLILDHLSIYFRSLSFHRMLELGSLNDSMFCLPVVKDYLEEIRVENERMGEMEAETIHLEDPIVQKFDLNLTSSFVKGFDLCIKTGKSLLTQKEMDNSGALDKITEQQKQQSPYCKCVGIKNAELFRKHEGDCMDLDGAKVVREELEKKPEGHEEENIMLRTNLNASLPLVSSLSLGIASLEEHIFSLSRQAQKIEKTTHVSNEDDNDSSIFRLQELEKLVAKVEALCDVAVDMEKLLLQERLDSNATLEAQRKEIKELKLRVTTGQQNFKERFGQTIKDIQLDQVSSSRAGSYGLNKIDNSKLDDELLELWETAEIDDKEEVVEKKSELPSSEVVEIEQSVDKLEVSIKVNESPGAWKRGVMEILVSDSHRLLILQKGLQELKTKWMISENKKHLKCVEHNTFKLKLTEAEAATLEQVDFNGRFKNQVRDILGSSNFAIGVIEQRQLLESAIRGSEKIGKLELDLQKIEYIFLKLQDENRRNRFGKQKAIILLRGYIHGKKDGKARRKGRFCGCMKPKTDC